VLDSPAQVEPTASSTRCPRHQVPMRVSDHMVADHAGARLRVAHVVCPLCPPSAGRRRLFFRLAQVN
jgi:hypothetical protein